MAGIPNVSKYFPCGSDIIKLLGHPELEMQDLTMTLECSESFFSSMNSVYQVYDLTKLDMNA